MGRIPLGGLIALAALGFLSGALAAEKFRFATPTKTSPLYNLPIIAAEERGFWRQQGLEMEYLPFRAGGAMHRGIAAGSVNIAVEAASSAIHAASRGLLILIVADLQAAQDWSVFVRPDSRIRKPQDLKGAKIGLAGYGGQGHAHARVIVQALDLEKDVKFVATGGTTETMAALKAGAVEAVVRPLFPVIPLKVKGELRQLDLSLLDYLPKEWMDLVVIARKDLVEKNLDAVKKAIKGVLQGAGFVMTSPAWTNEKLKSLFGYSEEAAKEVYPKLQYGRDGSISRGAIENVRNFLIQYGLLKEDEALAVDRLYTARLID